MAYVDGSCAHENDRSWLLAKLRSADVGASPLAVDLVAKCCDLYATHGLFDGDRPRPLDCGCPKAGECWGGAEERHPPRDWAPISVPWIGSAYRPGGVAAVAINFNAYGGLGAQWWIRNGAINALRAGKRKRFDYRAGAYLAMLAASLAGQPADPEPEPARAADGWEGCAFLEAVKCAPIGTASRPTDAMQHNCPTLYLNDELALLQPGALLLIGRKVADEIAPLVEARFDEELPGFRRGSASLAGRRIELFVCNHPSFGHWRRSTPLMALSLESRPLAQAR